MDELNYATMELLERVFLEHGLLTQKDCSAFSLILRKVVNWTYEIVFKSPNPILKDEKFMPLSDHLDGGKYEKFPHY